MSAFKTPPLKRHPSLQPLSRDHYQGLVQGRHLTQAADGNAVDRRAALAAFLDAWHTEILPHFADEERLLAPLADGQNRARLYSEHDHLRALAAEADQRRRQIDPGEDWVRTLGRALIDHIRWEEREMFPSIEAAAAQELDGLHADAERIEASRRRGRRTSARG